MSEEDPVVQAARFRISVLKSEICELEDFMQQYAYIEEKLNGSVPSRRVRGTPQKEMAIVVADILRQSVRPLSTRELYNILLDRGVIINGQNPVGNLGAKLAQMSEFSNVVGAGWKQTKTTLNCDGDKK